MVNGCVLAATLAPLLTASCLLPFPSLLECSVFLKRDEKKKKPDEKGEILQSFSILNQPSSE